ncbi:hypothetical protein BU17DRAFT_51730 [Hysterangium stoloniferum]|nr:hypothetical protein BU17DRAFT_51730 [Hysterangium stoloniferum]
MPPSTSSFLDLKAELTKQEAEFSKNKASGKATYTKGGIQRPGKKPTIWAKPNKGVASRNARDLEWAMASKPTLEAAKEALERKAAQYEKLKRGKTAGLSEKEYDSLLFDRKAEDNYDSDTSEDVDESLTIPKNPYEEDPIVDYEDEFGRMRTAPRSEVPRNLLPREEEPEADEDPYLIRGDANYFPTYEPSAEKVAAVEAALREDSNPATHYDATREVRPQGAAFYQFSKDEETRQKQMEDLKRMREETENARKEAGAAPGQEVRLGSEKRKREIEERRKAIEAKRRKTTESEPVAPASIPTFENSASGNKPEEAPRRKKKPKQPKPAVPAQSADEFLAALERDIMGKKASS